MWRILWQESKSAVLCDDMKAVLISCMQPFIKLLTIVKIRQAECSEICSNIFLTFNFKSIVDVYKDFDNTACLTCELYRKSQAAKCDECLSWEHNILYDTTVRVT